MMQANRGDEASSGLPVSLAARPRDQRRGLPIPPVNLHSDPATGEDTVDFTNINTTISTGLAANRRCSLCGVEMGYWVFRAKLQQMQQRIEVMCPFHAEVTASK
jgi:hypothetical protein